MAQPYSLETRSDPSRGPGGFLRWFLAGIPMGLLFLWAGSLELRWFLLLCAGTAIGLTSLCFRDKKLFYLALFSSTISVGLVLHLGLKPSSIYRSTHAFLISLSHIPLAILIGLHALRCMRNGTPIFSASAAWGAAILLLAVCTLSVVTGPSNPYGGFDLFALATSLVLFLATAHVVGDHTELKVVLAVIVASVAIQGIVAVLQSLIHSTLGLELFGAPRILETYTGLSKVSRAGGTLGHPNSLALYMDLFLPLSVSLFLCPSFRGKRFVIGCGALLGAMGLVATLSRGGLLATGFAVVAVLLFHGRRRIGWVRSSFALLTLLTLGSVLILATPNPIHKRFSNYDFGTAYGRYSLAGVAVNVIRENPLLGVGLNRFTEAARLLDNSPERIVTLWNAPVHNLFLFIAGETGLLGLSAFLLVLGVVARSLKAPLGSEDPLIVYTGIGVFMGLMAFLVHCMVDYVHWTRFNPFWFLAGFALSLGGVARQTPPE